MAASNAVCKVGKNCSIVSRLRQKPKMMVAVYEVTEAPKPKRHRAPTGSAYGTPIRICRGRLTAACNPGVCDCPDKTCRKRIKKTAIIWMMLKLAILGAALFETFRLGVWSDADKTADLMVRYQDWAEDFFPTKNMTFRTPEQIYDMFRIRYNLKNAWNNTIIGVNSFIASIPSLIYSGIEYLFKKKEPENLKK